MNTLTFSPADLVTLRAARDIIDRALAQVSPPTRTKLSRGPDGIHLDERGIETLYSAYDTGMTPHQARNHFDISYRAARLRHTTWRRKRKTA